MYILAALQYYGAQSQFYQSQCGKQSARSGAYHYHLWFALYVRILSVLVFIILRLLVVDDLADVEVSGMGLFFVYKQVPATGSSISVGGSVDLYLSKDPSVLESPEVIYYNPDEPDDTSADTDNLFK